MIILTRTQLGIIAALPEDASKQNNYCILQIYSPVDYQVSGSSGKLNQ